MRLESDGHFTEADTSFSANLVQQSGFGSTEEDPPSSGNFVHQIGFGSTVTTVGGSEDKLDSGCWSTEKDRLILTWDDGRQADYIYSYSKKDSAGVQEIGMEPERKSKTAWIWTRSSR